MAPTGLASCPSRSRLPQLNFHDLKHTAGTALLDEGINVKTAQSRLGHANPRTTLAVYAQATAEADREAARRLGERFRPLSAQAERSQPVANPSSRTP
ncbi:MAG: tyrosine-type recombinase/integrase [Steroidobacteraceae bacterium]